ncbi:MAG: exosortase [Thermoanaerobaculia bacterium]
MVPLQRADSPWPLHVPIMVGALVVVFAVLYAPVFAWLVRSWLDNEIYQHGFLVPAIAGYLVWLRRRELGSLPVRPSLVGGAAVLALGGLMLVLGKVGSVLVLLVETSLLVTLAGLVLLLLGPAFLKALALPLGYLSFMIPLVADRTIWVHWPFQLLAATVSTELLQLLGLAAHREGLFIVLPRVTLEIAEECSGIRFMISVIAVGIPLAYLTQRTWRRGVGLIAIGVAIGILANSVRVALIGVWAYLDGEVLNGPLHVLQGMFVAWAGYAALVVGAWALSRESVR